MRRAASGTKYGRLDPDTLARGRDGGEHQLSQRKDRLVRTRRQNLYDRIAHAARLGEIFIRVERFPRGKEPILGEGLLKEERRRTDHPHVRILPRVEFFTST